MIKLNRRAFTAMLGGALTAHAFGQEKPPSLPVTGRSNPDLAGIDRMMSAFMEEHKLPGSTLAISRQGRLVYARGFGYSDLDKREPVEPTARFRIASISKPLTAVATLLLIEQGKLNLDDRILDRIALQPHLEPGQIVDPRWKQVTIRHVLHHTGGWDRGVSYDPISKGWDICKSMNIEPPVKPDHVVRYMMGKPLDFDPGARFAYTNLGYLLLGRAIEQITQLPYERFVRERVLTPLGIRGMQLGRARAENRLPGEVKYYDARKRTGRAIIGPNIGETVPVQYGADNFEGYEAHGGWVASAVELVRFASEFDGHMPSKLLRAETEKTMWSRPDGAAGFRDDGKPKESYYGCGWHVRPIGDKFDAWHGGLIGGTSTLLVRRHDGVSWAVLFNTDRVATGKVVTQVLDPLIHRAADEVKNWPDVDLFPDCLPK